MDGSQEEFERPTTRSVGIRYGLILAVISVVYFLALSVSGVDMTQGPGRWLNVLFYAGILFFAHRDYKNNGDGFMSFGDGMLITFWTGAISSAIYTFFFYCYVKFVDAGFIEAIKDQQIEEFQNQGMSDAQIDQAMKYASMFTTPEVMSIFSLIGGLIFVLIVGLIVSLITQNKKPDSYA